jgi:hypothetical protein
MRVVLGYPKLGMLSGSTRDLGPGGMFVDTGRVTLPRDGKVRVYLYVPGPEAERFCVADARVVHSHSGGAGLAFQQLDDATRSALNGLMALPDAALDRALPGRPTAAVAGGKGLETPP